MLHVFAGGHRMGSTFQSLIGVFALKQLGITYRFPDSKALEVLHIRKIRESFKAADADPQIFYYAKAHAAFPLQVDAILTARHSRIFLVWRDQLDALISDFHYAQRRAGHHYASFDDYFLRRGRKILLRNCLQKVVWDGIDDDRVRAWTYLELVGEFERTAGEMLAFGGIAGVDLAALRNNVSIPSLRKTQNDPEGRFFREGGTHNLAQFEPSDRTVAEIEKILDERDPQWLGDAFEREDWLRVSLFGRESQEPGLRKTIHWWLYKTQRFQKLQNNVLPLIYKCSPRRLIGKFVSSPTPRDLQKPQ